MRIASLVFALWLLTTPAASQMNLEARGEVSFGYSYLSGDVGQHGWQLTGAYLPSDWLGLVADFSGHYGSDQVLLLDLDTNTHNFLFGPRVYFDLDDPATVRPFAHVLFGATRVSASSDVGGVDSSDTGFALALGGGADWVFTERFAVRGQIDWLRQNIFGSTDNNPRLSIGLVYRFD